MKKKLEDIPFFKSGPGENRISVWLSKGNRLYTPTNFSSIQARNNPPSSLKLSPKAADAILQRVAEHKKILPSELKTMLDDLQKRHS